MPDTKLSALTELAASPASDDEVYIRDISVAAENESKKITIANLLGSLPATTLTGAIDGNAQTMSDINLTVGAGRTLDISGGTLTLANDQISGDKVEGGTINAISITTLTAGTINAFSLGGKLTGGVNEIEGSSFDINGGTMAGVTMDGTLTVAENSIVLDSVIGSDQNHSGITTTGILGETVAVGEIIYLKDTDDEWHKAKADAEATANRLLGICLTAGDNSEATTILLIGYYRDDTAFEFGDAGKPLYLSDTTAGDFITTKPDTAGDIVRIIGYAGATKEEVFFNPDGAYVTAAGGV